MKTTVKNFHGEEVEVRFTFRGKSLYIERSSIPKLFSQPEAVRAGVEKQMTHRGATYYRINFTNVAEKFLRQADLRVAVELLHKILQT